MTASVASLCPIVHMIGSHRPRQNRRTVSTTLQETVLCTFARELQFLNLLLSGKLPNWCPATVCEWTWFQETVCQEGMHHMIAKWHFLKCTKRPSVIGFTWKESSTWHEHPPHLLACVLCSHRRQTIPCTRSLQQDCRFNGWCRYLD